MPAPSPLAALLSVAVGGACGAVCRYGVGLAVVRWRLDAAPLATLAVNVAGCLLIGMLGTVAEADRLGPHARLLLITGLLGGLTTFSTFGYETLALATTRGRFDLAAANLTAHLLAGLAAVWLGRWCVLTWLR